MHTSHTSTLRAVLLPVVLAWKSRTHSLMVLLALTGIVYAGASSTFPAPTHKGAGARQSLRADPSAALAQSPPYVKGEILVRFKPGTKHETMAAAHTLAGASEVQSFSVVQNLRRVRLTRDQSVPEALAHYRRDPDVLYAEPLYTVHAVGTPNDLSLLGQQCSDVLSAGPNSPVHALGSPTNDPLFPENLFQIDAPGAWNITTGSKSVVVVVIGTGVDYNHEDLRANMWRNPGEIPGNGRDDDGNGYTDDIYGINTVHNNSDPMDDGVPGYGTHEAGTIGAVGNNSIGVVGVNQNVSIMACKFLDASGEGDVADAITCLEYVKTMKEQGINIIATSNSWVVNPGRRPGDNFSQALYDAIDAQRQQGILFITAAGDATENNDMDHDVYPANFDRPNVIAVAATTSSTMLALYSNYGRHTVHLAAPGGDNIFPGILSTLPGNAYGGLFGSTTATVPHVTGVAALLKAQDLNRDWRAIKNLLLAGGDPLPDLADATITGRQLNARGSLTCTNAPVLSRFRPSSSNTISVALGTPVDVSVLHINCATPAGEVAVVVNPGNQTIILRDSGVDGDQAAGDGIYSARWNPATAGTYTLTFPGREGQDDQVIVHVLSNYTYTATPFVWRQITGTNVNLSSDLDFPQITLPFAISFGGVDFTTLYLSPHGTLNFTGPFTTSLFSDSENESIPTTASPTLVAPFWDRLAPQYGTDHNVFWAVIGNPPNRELVFEWRNVEYEFWLCNGDGSAGLTFQVVFFEGRSDILFNYAHTTFGGECPSSPDHGAGATVGVQVTSDTGTQFSFKSPSLHDQMALLWTVSAPPVTLSVTKYRPQ